VRENGRARGLSDRRLHREQLKRKHFVRPVVSTLSTARDTSDTSSSFYLSFTLVSFDIPSTYYNVSVKYVSTLLFLSIRLNIVNSRPALESWSHHRRVAVACGSDGWDAPDEELSNAEWELSSHVPPIRFAGSKGFKSAPVITPPILHLPTISA